jgi:hypothetical protein
MPPVDGLMLYELLLRLCSGREDRVCQRDGAVDASQLLGAGNDRALFESAALAGVALRGGTAVGCRRSTG